MRATFMSPRLAGYAAILGGVVYSVQSLLYAFTQISEVDEGAYLYQGYLFVKGIYHPFQAGGPWMYNAPLSYLFWGAVQALFGPGIRTGRYVAVFLGMLLLLAVWIAARRLGGLWWAALAVWAVALSPALIKLYSMAESQVLAACMLAWVLALSLGRGRPAWQVGAGSMLAGLIVLTRHNLVLILPILFVYDFWEHGRKIGLWAAAAGLLTVLVVHIIYWPGILVIWAPWLPAQVFPFLAAFRPPQEGSITLPPAVLEDQLLSLASGLRFQFTALAGSLACLLLWPRSDDWKNRSNYRAGVFLVVLFFSLLILHGWASLFNKFCIYCFSPYMAYFNVVALLLIVAVLSEGVKRASPVGRLIAVGLIPLLFAGVGFATFSMTGEWLLNLRIPRLKTLVLTGRLPEGFAVWDLMGSWFHLDYLRARAVVAPIAGFLFGLAVLLLTFFIHRVFLRKMGYTWAPFALIAALVIGTVLSPTQVMAGGSRDYDCQADNIRAYEQTGRSLAGIIPPGSKVYWDGGGSVLPLVYVPGISILPGQIYGFWSFSPDQDTARVLKFGLWNEPSAAQWRDQANFILIATGRYGATWDQFFHANNRFVELEPSPGPNPCDVTSSIRVFRRIP